jgi:hypothetical protein
LSVAGISFSTDEQGLREAFSRYGEVLDGKEFDCLFYFVMYDEFFFWYRMEG